MCGWKDRLCCSFCISSSMNADWNVFNTCFTSRVSVELEQRMFCRRPYQWMTAFTSEAWWWSTSDSSTWAATKRAFHAPLTLAMWNSLNLVLGDMVVFHIVISPACEIADTRYGSTVDVGKRETLCTCHRLFHNYLGILGDFARGWEREPGSTKNQNNILPNILKN